MEQIQTIILAVFAGIVTSISLYLFKLIFIEIILPWYRKLIYKGVDVSGEWVGKIYNTNQHCNITLTLKQNAHQLKGTYIATFYVNNEEVSLSAMYVSGEIWEGFIALKCRTISNRRLSFGSMLLKVNTEELCGHQIFRNIGRGSNEILHKEVTIQRRE